MGGLGTGGGRRRKLSGLLVWERSSVGEDKGGGKIHLHTGTKLGFVNKKIIRSKKNKKIIKHAHVRVAIYVL
jgi:hypothetical protein